MRGLTNFEYQFYQENVFLRRTLSSEVASDNESRSMFCCLHGLIKKVNGVRKNFVLLRITRVHGDSQILFHGK